MRKPISEEYLPVSDVAARTGRHVTTVYRWLDAGKVVGTTVAGHRFVLKSSLEEFLGPNASKVLKLVR